MSMQACLWFVRAFQALQGCARQRLLFWLCLALAVLAGPVGAQSRAPVDADSIFLRGSWCATDPQVTIDAVAKGSCAWQPMDRSRGPQGWDTRAFWLKLDVRNDSDQAVERWLELGQPQMAEVSLFFPTDGGWERREVGLRVPLNEREPIAQTYGVLPVTLAAASQTTVWVRMASDTVIILRASLWEPDEFRARLQQRQFWSSLGIGGLFLTVLFSVLMMALNRQAAYGFFALGLLGQFVSATMLSGVFQRFFWPDAWVVTSAIRDLGALVSVFGFSSFLRSFLPQMRKYVLLELTFRAAVYTCFAFLLARLAGLKNVDIAWFLAMTLSGLMAALICARAWREGDRAAGIMSAAFGTFVVFAVVRLLVLAGSIEFFPEITQVPFIGIFLVTPVVLLGLVDRTRQLQDELSRVQAESAAQLRFLAQMSHELRSPLDNVLGNAQLLAREARSPSQISGINSIFDSGRQLLRIIDHILDYARGSAGMLKIEPAPLRLGTFLRGIERMAGLLAVQRNNRFELKLQGSELALKALNVMADAERLRQVLGNLLGNAARHTSDGAIRLQVSAERLPEFQVQLDFSVDDTGEGISEQEQARIFRPFERAESSAQYAGKGAGLGLAIARQMVELMGGRLTVRSAPGQGASFQFSIRVPLLSASSASAPERLDGFDAAGYQGPRRVVMVVDDEDASRTVLGQLLQGLGFEVLLSRSGSHAAALLPGLQALDLVITDQYMPDGDGWLVLERVAALFPEVPVMMISAAPPSPPPDWNHQRRFAAQFLRPVDHAQLLARIGDLLDLQWSDVAMDRGGDGLPTKDRQVLPAIAAAQAIPVPHPRELQALAQLVELGQVTAIEEWGHRVKAQYPECTLFVEQVLQAVHRLDFQTLLHLASPALDRSPATARISA